MAINFNEIVNTIDDVLTEQGLYTSVSFTDPDLFYNAYDPVSGTYADNPTTYVFKGVLSTTNNSNESNSDSSTGLQIEVLPKNVMFTPAVDQVYEIDSVRYQVEYVDISPQNLLYSIGLRRK